MAHIMAPPRPAYMAEVSSLKSFRSGDAPSAKSGSVRARSFVFLRRSFLGPKTKDAHVVDPYPPDLKPPLSSDTLENVFPSEKDNTLHVPGPPRPRRKSFLHRISTAFRKDPKMLFAVPPLPPPVQQQRDIVQRLPSPKDPSQQQQITPRDSRFTVSKPVDSTAADRVKREWEEKTRIADAEQRERMITFKFGGRSRSACPLAVTVRASTDSLRPRKKAPPSLKSLKLRATPSGPPPDRALPPSPSQVIQFPTYSSTPHRDLSQPNSPSSPQYPDDPTNNSVVINKDYPPPSPGGSAFEEMIDPDPNSLSPPRRFPISPRSDSSSICTPSLDGSSLSSVDYSLELVNSSSGITSSKIAIRRRQDTLPFDLVQDEDEIDPCRPSPYAQGTLRKTSGINPTMYTPGAIATQVATIKDDESRRLTGMAYLS